MFLIDSLMISGIKWALKTVVTAAEAEMNDDTALREQLLEAEMRREMGEISDEEFEEVEADLLGRIREIKERREGAGPLAFGGAQPMVTSADSKFLIEASVSGDFYDPSDAPHTTVIETAPVESALAHLATQLGVEQLLAERRIVVHLGLGGRDDRLHHPADPGDHQRIEDEHRKLELGSGK